MAAVASANCRRVFELRDRDGLPDCCSVAIIASVQRLDMRGRILACGLHIVMAGEASARLYARMVEGRCRDEGRCGVAEIACISSRQVLAIWTLQLADDRAG